MEPPAPRRAGGRIGRGLRYAWAFFPNTLLGLLLLPLAALGGGRVRRRDGIVEAHGRAIAWLLERSTPLCGGAAALTLGHVVVARDRECLEHSRAHERVHVGQVERWGPFFLPAYLLSSLSAYLRGRDPYRDNRFEREAFRGPASRLDRRDWTG